MTEQQHKEFGTVLLLLFCSGFLAQGMRDPSSQTRDRACTTCMGRRSLKHWTAREVPWTYVQLLSYLFASLGFFLPCIYVRMLPCLLAVFGHGESEKEMDGEPEGSSVGQGTVYCPGCLVGGLLRWLCFTAGVRPALCTQPSVPGSADHSLFSFFRSGVGWMPLNCPRALPHPSWFLHTLPAPRPIAVLLNLLNDPVRASTCFLPGPCQRPSRAPEPRSAYCESDSHGG